MNSIPNFDMKNAREYPTYEGSPAAQGDVSTGQRIVRSFSSQVAFWTVLTILVLWAFFEKPFVSPVGGSLTADWLCFAGGLLLGMLDAIIVLKRATTRTPLWRRIPLTIAILAAAFIAVYFLGNNNFFFSLCEGGIAGSSIWRAIAAYHSNWIASSRKVYLQDPLP